jgi:hypothetical protein
MARAGEYQVLDSRSLWRAAPWLCATLLAIVLAPGCQSANESRARQGDPLTGEMPPPVSMVGPTPPSPGQNRAATTTPQTPQSTASKSIADILTQAEPLEGGKKLAIADNRSPGGGAWQPNGVQAVGQGGAPAIILRDPQVGVVQPVPAPGQSGAAQPVPQYSGNNLDPLQAQLRARGMVWQKTELVAGGVRFTCAVPNRQDATSLQIYQATAPDEPTAIQAVLLKINQQQ